VDQLLLFCYHYDPSEGQYTLAILNFLRAAGAVTVVAIGVLLFVMIRRDRGGRTAEAG
jgi:protein SCO1/2